MNTVLITGSSRGIGRETALVFAQNGWNVAIHGYRHPECLASLEQNIKRFGVQCLSFTGDISSSSFVDRMIRETISHFGKLDCLVNNAGISRVGLFTDTTEKDWQEIFHTNVMPMFASCKSVLPHMISAGNPVRSSTYLPCGVTQAPPVRCCTLPPKAPSTRLRKPWPRRLHPAISP